jgi:hypothetical protein
VHSFNFNPPDFMPIFLKIGIKPGPGEEPEGLEYII